MRSIFSLFCSSSSNACTHLYTQSLSQYATILTGMHPELTSLQLLIMFYRHLFTIRNEKGNENQHVLVPVCPLLSSDFSFYSSPKHLNHKCFKQMDCEKQKYPHDCFPEMQAEPLCLCLL